MDKACRLIARRSVKRAGQGQIDQHGQQTAEGRQLMPGDAHRESRRRSDRQSHGSIDEAADGGHAQPGNGQHVSEAGAAKIVFGVLW
jgi:hypothetical protein